jgi:hypothetical protein
MFGHGHDLYLHDNTFRRVVDQLRSLLSVYYVTPGELREAAVLASTMHEEQHIKPLFITKSDTMAMVHSAYFSTPPAMFGGKTNLEGGINLKVEGTASGRWKCDGATITEVSRSEKLKCICTFNGVSHSQTCKDYNWRYWHPVSPLQEHVYGEWHKGLGNDNEWRMCVRCQLSSAYIDHNKITACTGKYVQPKS